MKKDILIAVLATLALNFQVSAQTKTKGKTAAKPTTAVKATPVPPPVSTAVDPQLLLIGGEPVLKSEFERVFRKNNRDSVYTETSIREYLDLYINYKLKVKEAEALKLDTSESFMNELAGYRKQLAQPYLTDKEVNESLIKEAYERLKKDVRASHILLKMDANALPKDTVAVYNRIMKIREMIMKGADFGKMAKDSSEDPSATENRGDLGYFTGMQMVYPFESVAFTSKIGQVSMPVRTRFGYHLIKVADVRDAQGEVHVAHIMIRIPKDASDSALKAEEVTIKLAMAALKSGMPWDTAVVKFSEDKGSVKRGGELPWFGTGRMVPEFEKAAFALTADGDYSQPIKTSYGWHIIRRLERRGIPAFDDKKAELKQMIARDSRNEASKISMVNKIKKDYQFKEVPKTKDEFLAILDTNLTNGEWDLNKAEKFVKPLFSLTDGTTPTSYTQQDFAKYISTHQTKRPAVRPLVIGNEMYNDWVSDACIAYEESRLDKKYPEFKNLMKEYRDGILLFDLTDKMVWSKAVKDTVGLEEFYTKNKNNYMWGERADVTIYTCSNAKAASDLRKQLAKGKKTADQIISDINKNTANAVSKREARYSKGDEMLNGVDWKSGLSNDVSRGDQVFIFDFKKMIAPEPKDLDDAKGLITADYQTYLEKEWISSLKKKYPAQVNNEVLQTLWRK